MEEDDECVIVEEIICEKASTEIASLPPTDEISRVLECPVCLHIPFGPIVMCSSGHSLCRECTKKITTCPICQSSYTNIRCLGLEAIISMVNFECPNKDQGCQKVLPAGGRYNMHACHCDYRAVTCNEEKELKCLNTKVPFTEYVLHLQKCHLVQTMPTSSVIKLTQSIIPPIGRQREWPYTCFSVDNLNFLEKCRITDSVIYWWICVHSSKRVAAQYIASLALSRESTDASAVKRMDKICSVKWKIPVLSIQDYVDEKSPQVAVYPLKDLLKLCDATSKTNGKKKYTWQLEVSIQNVKDDEKPSSNITIPTKRPLIIPSKSSNRRKSKKTKLL